MEGNLTTKPALVRATPPVLGCWYYNNSSLIHIIMSPACVKMLSHHFSLMAEEEFRKLPTSTNAVESHNRLSKANQPEILKVAMLTTYKVDMATALEHMARSEGMSTSYDDTSEEARVKTATKTRAKRRLEEGEDDGPPDKRRHFQDEIPSKFCNFSTIQCSSVSWLHIYRT